MRPGTGERIQPQMSCEAGPGRKLYPCVVPQRAGVERGHLARRLVAPHGDCLNPAHSSRGAPRWHFRYPLSHRVKAASRNAR